MNLLRKAIKINFSLSIINYHMREKFLDTLIKVMHYYGLYVDDLPNAETLYNYLNSDHIVLKQTKLRQTTTYLKRANDHKSYSQILHKFVPQMDMDYTHLKFTERGYGANSLHVYRKLKFRDEVLFEKVYFNSSLELLRVKWFYDNIHPLLNCNIKVPPLYRSIKGELITVVYFKFIDLVSLAINDISASVFNLSRGLYELSLNSNVEIKIKNAPIFLKDYKAHFQYVINIEKAHKKLIELRGENFPLKNTEKIINDSPHILTHGDIHWGNVFENKYLIDWDSFGLYPIGFDVAYLLFRLHKCKLNYEELSSVLEIEYRSIILKEEWDVFELNCLYFYYVFTVAPLVDMNLDFHKVQIDILDRIEQLTYKNGN